MVGKIKVWYMTDEELASYVAKHPIKEPKKVSRKDSAKTSPDYKWRSKKANESSLKSKRA
ncbi:hypothetical protein [Bacillus infantis]|uniref:Uncharacterized protein n=1 Tax=Bacillus infantis TaxID=324767 RepID=A0A5D4RJS5_9BACI|nr:hypothetical protein [Bacillus infantis]TYS50106.1 hypothetical protein FZD51_06015 [Bacillus infantis]